MTDKLLKIIKEQYSVCDIDVGEFGSLKAKGMKFTVSAYHAKGLGHVSIMRAKGFFGLMKMDTFIIVPDEKDLPLYSYDGISAMGNHTLIVELYDTLTQPLDMSALDVVKAKFSHVEERDPGEHWYDNIKLPESISKKGKKAQKNDLDALTVEHLKAFLNTPAMSVSDRNKKKELSKAYVDGLLTQGGPSTDVFKAELGAEKTERLFKTIIFGTDIEN